MSVWTKIFLVLSFTTGLYSLLCGSCNAKSAHENLAPNQQTLSNTFIVPPTSESLLPASTYDEKNSSRPAVTYRVSLSDNFEIAASVPKNGLIEGDGRNFAINPEISILATSYTSNKVLNQKRVINSSGFKPRRNDRYRDTIPAVFRLTLKGYSIVEYSGQHKESWSFNKVSNKALRKPVIMFSFTKRF